MTIIKLSSLVTPTKLYVYIKFLHFLQKTLPLLRAQSRLPQSTTPQKILPQQPIQQKPATPIHTTAQPGQKPGAQVQKIQIVPQPGQQMLKQVILTPQQQQLLRRQHQLNAQRVLLTTSTGAVSASQAVSTSRNVVMVHAPPGSVGTKMVVAPVKTQAGTMAASAAAADKLKPKGFTGISRYNIAPRAPPNAIDVQQGKKELCTFSTIF